MKTIPKFLIIFDSIRNSVFQGQVIEPFKKADQPIILISFEKKAIPKEEVNLLVPKSIAVIQLKRTAFMGGWSLRSCVWQLDEVLSEYPEYELVARGPQAGYVASKVVTPACKMLTIQARGLLAEEYKFNRQEAISALERWLTELRYLLFARLEYKVYTKQQRKCPYTIEAVSPALKDYIIHRYDGDRKKYTVAKDDIPQPINPEERLRYKSAIRTELQIPDDALVYCYNGSAKSWQCPEQTVEYFKKKLTEEPNSYLLVLTADTITFASLVREHALPEDHVCLKKVDHKQIYQYLCAANYGLLFRQKHIINWVSRPTKALEYKAVGLPIIHNNTVDYIKEVH